MTLRWEQDLPVQIDAYIGYCPYCNSRDELIFILEDKQGKYEHCMQCSHEWSLNLQ